MTWAELGRTEESSPDGSVKVGVKVSSLGLTMGHSKCYR